LGGSSPTSRLDFDSVLLGVVEDTLALVFGRSTADMILDLLEKKGLRRDEIPGNVDQFNVSLTRLLGQSYPPLERLMVKRLCSRLQVEDDPNADIKLVDLVSDFRRRFKQ